MSACSSSAGQRVERDRAAAVALSQSERAVVAPVRHEQRLHAAVAQRARRELGVLAGADHEHAPVGEVAEEVGGQLHRHRRHRHARARHLRLAPHALAGGERVAEQPVRHRPGHALDQRHLVRALHLPLHLGLADDHRVEPGGDREEVLHRRAPAQRVDRAEQLRRPQSRLPRQDARARRSRPRPGRRPPGTARCGCRSRSPPPRGWPRAPRAPPARARRARPAAPASRAAAAARSCGSRRCASSSPVTRRPPRPRAPRSGGRCARSSPR